MRITYCTSLSEREAFFSRRYFYKKARQRSVNPGQWRHKAQQANRRWDWKRGHTPHEDCRRAIFACRAFFRPVHRSVRKAVSGNDGVQWTPSTRDQQESREPTRKLTRWRVAIVAMA